MKTIDIIKLDDEDGGGLSIHTWQFDSSNPDSNWYSCLAGWHNCGTFEDNNQGPFDSEQEAFEYQLDMLIKMVVMVKKAMVMERGK